MSGGTTTTWSRRRRVLVTAAIGLGVSLGMSVLALMKLAPVSSLDHALQDIDI